MNQAIRPLLYALVATLGWGALAGYLRAPFWIAVVGALAAAATCLWFERGALRQSAAGARSNPYLLLAPAYAFLAMVAIALSGIAYALSAGLHR